MSKISLTPNDSGTGTFTIQSPDSDTNRTLTLPDAGGELMTYVTAATLSNRRLNLNGAMTVAQRGTSSTANGYLVDRWRAASFWADDLVHTYSQSTDAPAGFSNSFKVNVDTAETTLDADESWKFEQRFEGQDLQMLAKGTSDAKALTVSFWVKSSTTGTYICELDDRDNTRAYSQAYTINSADTWEYKTLTYAGDTTGALDNDNEQSFRLAFFLAAGSDFTSGTLTTGWTSQVDANRSVGQTNLMAAVNNYWQITGVQLEAGSVATPFEHRSYGDELARCQRYFEIREWNGNNTRIGMGYCDSTTSMIVTVPYFVTKRVDEPVFTATGTGNIRSNTTGTNRDISSGSISMSNGAGKDNAVILLAGLSGSVGDGQGGQIAFVGAGSLQFDAEL